MRSEATPNPMAHSHDQAGDHAHHTAAFSPRTTSGSPGDPRRAKRRRLTIALSLSGVTMLVEIAGGWLTGSLALIADAAHMAADVAAVGLAVFAAWVAERPPDSRRTFGHTRAEVLAALAQGAGLIAVAVAVAFEAWDRVAAPPAIAPLPLLAIAAIGLLVNAVCLRLLGRDHGGDLNLHGAWLHVLGDLLGSIGAITAGALIWAFGWNWADPAASLAIAALIVTSAWRLLRSAVDVLMETAPPHLDVEEIRRALSAESGVAGVHDLHVWTIGGGETSLSSHVVAADGAASTSLLERLHDLLASRFGIRHATLQLEPVDFGARPHTPAAPAAISCANACDQPGTRSHP
jgi:cobalt-zinc-cadmium efflux system protein